MEYSEGKSKRMEGLLESKSFAQLSAEEKEFVLHEAGSEREYNLLRKISTALVAEKADLSPDPQTLRRLKESMKNTRPVPWYKGVLTYNVPAYAVIVILLLMALWFRPETKPNIATNDLQAVIKTDTVFVPQTDTVFVERVIVKYLSSPTPVDDYTIVKNLPREGLHEGVNMKEKEELESLLVSGS